MTQLLQAVRALRHQPGFSLVAILTLALGIGATTAIFTVVDGVILRPLPFADASRVVVLQERAPSFPAPISLSVLNYPDVRDQAKSFGRVGAMRNVTMNLTGPDASAEPVRVAAKMISADVLSTLQVQPLVGRAFAADDDRAGAEAVALITYALWQSRLGGQEAALKQPLQLDGRPVTIIGVLPPSFKLFSAADVFVPLWPWLSQQLQDRTWHPGITGIARLNAGVSIDQARTELEQISVQLEKAFPESNLNTRFIATPALDVMVQGVRTALMVLVSAVAGVLLIACINVAGLLLARGLGRRRELAVRTALGASRGDIVKLVLSESVVLGVLGAIAGFGLAWLLVPALTSLAGPTLPRSETVAIDARALAFTVIASLVTSVLFGLLPAISSARVDLRDVLSEGARGQSGGRRQQRTRRVLVAAEIGLTMALLIAAGLLIRSFNKLQGVDAGFNADRVLVADVPLSPKTYGANDVRTNAVERLLERTRALPGVTNAAVTTFLPLSGTGSSLHFNIQGRQPASAKDWIMASPRAVTRTYFSTMGIPIKRGRGFTADDKEGSPHVIVINQAMAKIYFPSVDPIGQHLSFGTVYDGSLPWLEVVGVTGDVLQSPDADAKAEMFVPYEQYPDSFFAGMYRNITVVTRTAGDSGTLGPAFRQVVAEMDRNQPVVNVRTMNTVLANAVAQPKFRSLLLALFAAIALVLAGIGVYGLLAHGVAQRRGEFGVRLALGASSGQVIGLIVREGLVLMVIGIAVGAVGAVFAVRLLSTMLFSITPWDASTWIGAAGALALVALLASWIPARRAVKVPPSEALRS